MLDGWLEFNRVKWALRPMKIRLSENNNDPPSIEAVIYLDKKGRITQPPLNPYLPIMLFPSKTEKAVRLYRQWTILSGMLADVFKTKGIRSSIFLPPEALDVRQWQWRGFLAEVRYTFYNDFPIKEDEVDYQVQKQIKKAKKAGYISERANINDLEEIAECLSDTETRQRFKYGVNAEDMKLALRFLGEEQFRVYICRAPNGEVTSARIILSRQNSRAIDWVAGTKRSYYKSGATQGLIFFALKDLEENGAIGLDYCGANIPTVSTAKANWGGKLIPYYLIRALNIRTLYQFIRFFRKQPE